jgi:biopolymer transport protein ExbD
MAEKRRELDVWIVQTNSVYRRVPYSVVTDWIQEGRLLAEDKVRAAGGDKWHLLGNVPALAAFLPQAEPHPIEDRAEALEPVEAGFDWTAGRPEDEEGDVDMIPLIDVSLVLLIFFMMTAAISSGILSPIKTPGARRQLEVISEDMIWVGIDRKQDEDGGAVPLYSVGEGETSFQVRPGNKKDKENYVTPEPKQMLAALAAKLAGVKGEVRLRIRADRDLMIEVVDATTARLQRLEAQLNKGRPNNERLRFQLLGEVSEPQTP